MNTIRNSCFTLLAVMALHPLVMSQTVRQQAASELRTPLLAEDGAASPDASSPSDDQWHIGFFPYLWFPGMHGTTGVLGFNTSVKASPGDLLSHFDLGLMSTLEARKQHLVLPVDLMWVALSDDKGVPTNEQGVESISVRIGEFVLTPKAGYEIIDTTKVKVDSLVGLRYWHLGERLHFNPVLFSGVSTSENWVDAVAGARIEMILLRKPR